MALSEILLIKVWLEFSEVLNPELRDWGKALRVFSRLRLSIHTFSTDRCAGVEAARWRQFSEVKEDQTCKSEWIRVMWRSLAVTNTISKLQMRLSVLQLSIHGSITNKDSWKGEMLHMASSLCQLHTHTHIYIYIYIHIALPILSGTASPVMNIATCG